MKRKSKKFLGPAVQTVPPAEAPMPDVENAHDPDAGKRIRIGIYRDVTKTLFVPTLKMWEARRLFTDPKYRRSGKGAVMHGAGANVESIEEEVGSGGHGAIRNYLRLYREIEWYEPWQIEGKELPKDIRALGAAEIAHAKAAWAYGDILGSLIGQYGEWFSGPMRFPVDRIEEFMFWLYGGAAPQDWLILPEWVFALRDELTLNSLCKEAEIAPGTVIRWRKDELRRQALDDTIAALRAGREKPTGSVAWNHLFGATSGFRNKKALTADVVDEVKRRSIEGEGADDVALSLGISRSSCYAIRNGDYEVAESPGWARGMAASMIAIGKAARESAAIARAKETLKAGFSPQPLRKRADDLGLRAALDA